MLAESGGRQAKEIAIRRKRLVRLLRRLRAMSGSQPHRDQLLLRIGAAKQETGRAFGFVKIRLPPKDEEVTHAAFTLYTGKTKLKAAEQRDGHYLSRSNLVGEGPAVLWTRYVQLTQVESVFPLPGKRTGHPAHLPSDRTPDRRPCAHRTPRLLSSGHD